jgi:hypothetical protein
MSAATGGGTAPLPIPVSIVTQPGQANPAARQGICFTMVVATGTNPVDQLLGRDYDRVEARVLAVDEPVVLAQSKEMAANAANQVTGTPNPVGAYLPTGVDRVIQNCDELWVAATSATAGRVSVIVSRRLREPPAGPEH